MIALLPQTLVDGILIGGIYITIAIGFSLTYGVMHIIDFAVGEWIMLGAFLGFYLSQWTRVDPLVLLPAVFLVFALVGYALQPVVQRVVSGRRGNPVLMGLVFTFGLALMLRGAAQTVLGNFPQSIATVISNESFSFERGDFFLTVPAVRLAGLAYALAITGVLHFLLKKTDFGLAGKRTSSFVFAIYVGISAMTGVLIGTISSITTQMGPEQTILAFFVVVLAGMGYLAGVPWAAFLLGIINAFFPVYLDASYTLLAVFGVLYLILLVSPRGLFAKGV
jgi:branched-chain amino acid transport system permease protein